MERDSHRSIERRKSASGRAVRPATAVRRPVVCRAELTSAIERGIAAVDAGHCHVIDIKVLPDYMGLLG